MLDDAIHHRSSYCRVKHSAHIVTFMVLSVPLRHHLHLPPPSTLDRICVLHESVCMPEEVAVLECRIKREEDRLKREIEEREIKEAEELLAKSGKGKKLKEGEKLDKNAIMQVTTLRHFRRPEVHF